MELGKGSVTCEQARAVDIVDYLARLGFEPVKIKGDNFWYHSPLRQERTPSFKVNRRINRWYDFGEGCGGSLIDFAIRFKGCTIFEFLSSLRDGENLLDSIPWEPPVGHYAQEPRIELIREQALRAAVLLDYLRDRRIPIELADRFCREVHYQVDGKPYFAIGFRNDGGGWECRNPYFKGSIAPKGITTLLRGSDTVAVFEGFMDFLSFQAIQRTADHDLPDPDFLILNSLTFFERSRSVIEQYRAIQLFLDNDPPGRNCCRYALSVSSKYIDRSDLYQNHKDLNEFLCQFGKGSRKAGNILKR